MDNNNYPGTQSKNVNITNIKAVVYSILELLVQSRLLGPPQKE